MVNNAAIVSIINKLTEKNRPPCKKTLQKIVFLIEEKGVDLGFDYGIHFYGPYSADLDYTVRELSDDGILNIKYTSAEHIISVHNDSEYLPYENDIVNSVIEEFSKDSPNELELLATALYVYRLTHNISNVKNGVIKIKGMKYSDQRIDKAISRLSNVGYFVT